MRLCRVVGVVAVAACLSGCFLSEPFYGARNRPPVTPAPETATEEIRDARSFLALPDDSMVPASGFTPRWAP